MQLHPLTLAFAGIQHGLEEKFRCAYYLGNRRTIRWSLLAGLGAYLAFGVLDWVVFPEAYGRLWRLRFGVACPWILATLLATWLPGVARLWQPVLALAVVVCGGVIVAMTVVAPPPFNNTYYAGVALVLVYGYAVSRLRFLWASVAGWTIVLAYGIGAWALQEIPLQVLVGNSFFFIGTNLLGMVASYAMEYHARRDFWMVQELAAEKARVHASHRDLQGKIEELRHEQETVRVLRGLIPICAHCKRIRDDKGYWNQLELFIRDHSHAEFSHGICPECAEEHYGKYLE